MIFEGLSIFGGPTEINSSQAFEVTLMHIEHEGCCSLSLEWHLIAYTTRQFEVIKAWLSHQQ